MICRLPIVFTAIAIATITVGAIVVPRSDGSSCNTGSIQCCESIQQSDSPEGTNILDILGINLSDIQGAIGLQCSPLNILGISGSTCQASPVCCEDNSYGGLISLGCAPVIL